MRFGEEPEKKEPEVVEKPMNTKMIIICMIVGTIFLILQTILITSTIVVNKKIEKVEDKMISLNKDMASFTDKLKEIESKQVIYNDGLNAIDVRVNKIEILIEDGGVESIF